MVDLHQVRCVRACFENFFREKCLNSIVCTNSKWSSSSESCRFMGLTLKCTCDGCYLHTVKTQNINQKPFNPDILVSIRTHAWRRRRTNFSPPDFGLITFQLQGDNSIHFILFFSFSCHCHFCWLLASIGALRVDKLFQFPVVPWIWNVSMVESGK